MLDLGHVSYPGAGNWASSARQFERALEGFNRR
jgi:hypothetical protein